MSGARSWKLFNVMNVTVKVARKGSSRRSRGASNYIFKQKYNFQRTNQLFSTFIY